MPRSLSAAVLSAIAAKTITLALFAEIAFADNTYYLFSGVGTLTPAGPPSNPASTFPYGETFNGMGQFARVSGIPQTTKVQAQSVTLALSGIPAALVAEATEQVRIPGTAAIWLGFFDANGNLLLDPVQLYAGGLDVPSLTDGGDTSTIEITCENPLLSLNLAPGRTFDDPDQQKNFPGDLGFSFVEALANLNLFWPAPINSGSPWPVYMVVTPSAVDIAVGGTTTISITMHYSDLSTYTKPANTGSGPAFLVGVASSDSAIATFDYTSGEITGRSPGQCNIMARVPSFNSGTGAPSEMYRSVASVIVHS